MGWEAFLVSISSDLTHEVVADCLLAIPGVRPQSGSDALPGYRQYVYEDPSHIIELETSSEAAQAGTRISIRFALCQPASIDGIFAEFVADIAQKSKGAVMIAADAHGELAVDFQHTGMDAFAKSAAFYLGQDRAIWRRDFPDVIPRVTCGEAIEILVKRLEKSR